MAKASYAVIVPCKDGETTIERTLRSLLAQSIPAQEIIVLDDASRDRTPEILKRLPQVRTIRLEHNLPRDWTRVGMLFALGVKRMSKPADYVMISGDDCFYAKTYVEELLKEFDKNPALLVCSGSHGRQKVVGEAAPHGAGRVFRYSFLRSLLPWKVTAAWESWFLFKALQVGGKIERVANVSYRHLKPYSSASVRTFGYGMYELGYPFIVVLGRFAKSVLFEPRKLQQVQLIVGYLEYRFRCIPRSDVAHFVDQYQKQRVRRFVSRVLRA
jgi:glycosyltransferase involved in cell wall biosynthesis